MIMLCLRYIPYDSRGNDWALWVILGAEYPSPKKVNLSIMVGLYQPKKVKGYLLSY